MVEECIKPIPGPFRNGALLSILRGAALQTALDILTETQACPHEYLLRCLATRFGGKQSPATARNKLYALKQTGPLAD